MAVICEGKVGLIRPWHGARGRGDKYSCRICHMAAIQITLKETVCSGDCAGRAEARNPNNGTLISAKSVDFGSY